MTKPLAYSHSALKDFDNCPLAFYHKRVLKDVKDPPSSYATYGEEVHKALENRIKSGTPLPEHLARYEGLLKKITQHPTEAEVELALTRRLAFVDWFHPEVFFRAKIDVVTRTSEDSIWVCDWKTGARRPDFGQLEISAWALMTKYPEVRTVKTAFAWIKEDKMDSETYTRQQREHLGVKHISRIITIENHMKANNWPARPSGLCRFCGYLPHCTYGKK